MPVDSGIIKVEQMAELMKEVDELIAVLVSSSGQPLKGKSKKEDKQMKLGFIAELEEAEEQSAFDEALTPSEGKTVLDHLHQSMILFAAGRGEALKRFLIEEGIGRDQRFGGWHKHYQHFIRRMLTRNGGLMVCWRGKRDLDCRFAIAIFRLRYCILPS
jgi:hypothetical protein